MDGEPRRHERGAEAGEVRRSGAGLARQRALAEVLEMRESAGRAAASWGLLELADTRDGLAALDGLLDAIGRGARGGRCRRAVRPGPVLLGAPGAADAAGKLVSSASGSLRQSVERFCSEMGHYRETAG